MHDLLSDLRYAWRMLRKAPITSLVAVLSLGFAIATNTTVFSVASAFLFETFRWRAPDELLFVLEMNRNDGESGEVSPGTFLEWKESTRSLAGLEAYTIATGNLTGGDEPERIEVVEATPGLLDLLGRPPSLGRGFRAEEAGDQGSRVAVLTHAFFEHRFGADPNVLGSSLSVDGEPHTIVGVMPRSFDFLPADVEIFRPVDLAPRRHDRTDRSFVAIGRLATGSGPDDVRAELGAVAERLEAQYPDTNRGYGVEVETLRELFPGEVDTRIQYILLTVGALVLAIASANLVSLYLARGDARRAELSLRLALGAGSARLGRQLMTESLLVGSIGGVLGIAGAIVWSRAVAGFMPAMLPEVFQPKIDALVLAYGVAVSLVAGVLLGVAPALQAARVDPATALGEVGRGGGTGGGSRRRRRLRASFIVAETAVALALLTAAAILTDTFESMVEENGAIVVDGVLTMELTADEHRFPEEAGVAAFYREVLRRLDELPGVESTAALGALPRSRNNPRVQITIDGRPAVLPTEAPWIGWQPITAGYFTTLGIPIVAGRGIETTDRADTALVAVVNQSFERVHFPGESALGRRVTLDGASREIVGVCADFRQSRMPEIEGTAPAAYLPFEQQPLRTASLAARVSGDPMAIADAARQAVWSVDPDQPITLVQTLRGHIETELGGPLVISQALSMMGAVALILSAIGMYGLIAHDVAQRRREIGIRMALGAAPAQVIRGVTLRGLTIAGLGMALGVPMAWAMARAISAALQGMAPVDPASIALIALLLGTVALVASWLPALRAARIRPARVLQSE